ncbi:MAG TPA: J domain-containing protein, partial [Kofleriaceae bacterium]
AIDGTVLRSVPVEPEAAGKLGGGKTWLEVELFGFTEDIVAQIHRMAAGEAPELELELEEPHDTPPAPPPPVRVTGSYAVVEELPADERALFQQLTGELRRLRQLAVHEVLGVERDADAEQIRQGWMKLVRRHHPDLVARRNAPAITHLAEELMILANRAYDRLRSALVAEGRATAVGPALATPPGWLVGFDDISSTGSILRTKLAQTLQQGGNADAVEVTPAPAPPSASQVEGGEAFELRARAMLGDGDADNAQEVLAAALCVYPRSRPLRSLYYVASAISALGKGEVMLATSQLETALAHHETCDEAAAILDMLRRPSGAGSDEMKRLFR